MNNEKQIIVLSRNYSNGLAVARSLGSAGFTVDMIASSNTRGANRIAELSKFVRNFSEVVSKKVKEDESDPELIREIMKYAPSEEEIAAAVPELPDPSEGITSISFLRKPVLFPTDDYTTSIIDNCRDELSKYFYMPFVEGNVQGALTRLMDKTIQCRMANEIGLLTPATFAVSLREEDIVIPEGIIYPCYVKPIRSIEGYKTEMAVCEDEEELMAHLRKLRGNFAHRDVIVQEYLKIDQEYASAGYCADQDVILPALIRKTRIGQHGRGVTLTGEFVPFEVLGEEVCSKAVELLQSFHYTGNFGMEFNVVGDKIYFNEVNLRSAGEAFAYYKCGVNLPLMFVDNFVEEIMFEEEDEDNLQEADDQDKALDSSGEGTGQAEQVMSEEERQERLAFFYKLFDIDKNRFTGYGKTLLYDKIAWEDFAYGHISEEELDECIERSEITILCDDNDPEPGDLFVDTLQAKYDRRIERERREKRKEICIEKTSEARGIDRDAALAEIKDIRSRLGITYRDYEKYKFWNIPCEEQEGKYSKILESKEKEKRRKDVEKPLVVVLTRVYSTGLAVVRSLGSAGYPVDLVGNSLREGGTDIAGASKYVRNYVEVISRKVNGGGDDRIMHELRKYRALKEEGRRIVLFPTDDYTASVVDANRRELKKIFIMPYIEGGHTGAMTARMSKTVQSRMAAKAGFLMPEEWVISLRNRRIKLPDDIKYPCFCKPIESITGYKREMAKCDDAAQLKKHLVRLRSRYADRDVLVQEYLDIDYEIDMSGVSFGNEIIIPAIIKKTQVAQHEKGVTLAGNVVPFEELGEDVRQAIIEFVKLMRYNGMFDLELNVVRDKVYFNEMNLRSGGPNYSYFMSGVNLPVLAVKGLLKQPHSEEEEKVAAYGKSFIYEKVAWDDYAACFIDRKQLNNLLSSADIRLIESKDDPVPTRMFNERTEAAAEEKRARIQAKRERARKVKLKSSIKKTIKKVAGGAVLAARGYPQARFKNRRKASAENPRVLVAGRNWCSNLCMARSIAEGGFEPEVLRIVQRQPKENNILYWLKPEMYSKHVKAFYFLNSKRRNSRILKRLIKIADRERKMLIIPADDLVAHVIDANYRKLSKYYLMPNIYGIGGGVRRLMSKETQKKLAAEAGLPVIHSCVISSEGLTEGDEIILPEGINYPCFIKPNVSRNSSKSKMMKCENEEELLATLEERRKKGYELLIEDFVEIKRELSYLGLSTEDGVVCPGYFEAVVEGEGSHRGVAMLGRLLPTEDAEPLMSQVVKFIESLRFNGLFDVDLIETTDGEVYFVELNMRYGASGYALTKGGANLPAMFADYMFNGTPIDKNCKLNNIGQTFTSEKVLIDEYIEGIIDFDTIDELMERADIHFVKDEKDPKPYRHLTSLYPKAKTLREERIRKEERLAQLLAEQEAAAAEAVREQIDESGESDN